jgi:biotin carboxyl carrier protein
VVKEIKPQVFWRTIELPGVVTERRGRSDRHLIAPLAGVVKQISAIPGEAVLPGADLVVLTLTSELLQNSQTELYKNALEMKLTQTQLTRQEELVKSGAGSQVKLEELHFSMERLQGVRKSYRQDLATRGLSPTQIDDVEAGVFLKEITLRAPAAVQKNAATPQYELEELKVQPGDQVQAGQVLCVLGDHQNLYLEGRGFKDETPWLEKAAEQGWLVQADFGPQDEQWPALKQQLAIQYLTNSVEDIPQTVRFYVPLGNEYREYTRNGRTHRVWRYRTGQKALLRVPVQGFKDVFVVPVAAVVREGPEAYVFRQNGPYFERRPVHVLHEDHAQVVIANDGSIVPDAAIAHNAAAVLNRALKAQQSAGEGGHGHDHHGHTHN